MIKIDWIKGETELKGSMDEILMEYALLSSTVTDLLKKEFTEDKVKALLKMQLDIGINMSKDDKKDYIVEEKYKEEHDA